MSDTCILNSFLLEYATGTQPTRKMSRLNILKGVILIFSIATKFTVSIGVIFFKFASHNIFRKDAASIPIWYDEWTGKSHRNNDDCRRSPKDLTPQNKHSWMHHRNVMNTSFVCGEDLSDDFLLNIAYSTGRCDPRRHKLPVMRNSDFLKPCSFAVETTMIYFIMANKQIEMLKRILDRLTNAHNLLVVHIDLKARPIFRQAVVDLVSSDSNRCLVEFGNVVYLTATDIETITAGMGWALSANNQWTHFIPLTGQDYPLHSGENLNKRISAVGNKTWIKPRSLSKCCDANKSKNQNFFYRVTTFCFPCLGKNGDHFPLLIGWQDPWIFRYLPLLCWTEPLFTTVFARQTVEYIITDPVAIANYAFFSRFGDAIVELFWPSLLHSMVPAQLHEREPCFMSWTLGTGEKDTAEIDGTHNTFLTFEERDYIRDAYKNGTLFARKFFHYKTDILDFIDHLDESGESLP